MTKFRLGYISLAVLLAFVALVRVLSNYPHTAQAFDEPIHVAAGIELLDRGTYTSDPVHPPLARLAIGLPLYIAGERYPKAPLADLNAVGNAILNDSGRYIRNLELARIGVLPFLLLGCAVVLFWARQEYGDLAGVMAVAMFTTLPVILAFSGIAYTDIVAASTQAIALWTFVRWFERPSVYTTVGMGTAVGLALMAKATTCIYLPASVLALIILKWAVTRLNLQSLFGKHAIRQLVAAGVIAIIVVWAGYGFAVGHVRESMNLSVASMPTFQHFPALIGRIGRNLILSDPNIPCPALIRGLATAWVLNKTHPPAYLLGHIKEGGWWYFFLVGIGVKSTIPFLVLAVIGLFSFRKEVKEGRWSVLAPAVCALAILLVTMAVKYNAGVRHVLVVFPLLSVVAGYGASFLWHLQGPQLGWGRVALGVLLICQGVSTLSASDDYIAYFNEFAGKDPSMVMVAGCDLDCGQDLFALAAELKARHISHASLALWTSADMSKQGFPDFDVPQPYQPVKGWFAISLRALRFGDLFHSTYPPGAFAWLNGYQPTARVGKTILLYHIPE